MPLYSWFSSRRGCTSCAKLILVIYIGSRNCNTKEISCFFSQAFVFVFTKGDTLTPEANCPVREIVICLQHEFRLARNKRQILLFILLFYYREIISELEGLCGTFRARLQFKKTFFPCQRLVELVSHGRDWLSIRLDVSLEKGVWNQSLKEK